MKKVAIAIVVLLLLAVGGLLVLPSFWDWNAEKGRIAALVKEHSGRDLAIAGDVSLQLLPAPAFSAREVTLANVEGGSDPAMVQLDELRIRVALAPLLRGQVRVESVTLVNPRVLLEVLPDGRTNWSFAGATELPSARGEGTTGRPAGATGGEESVRVDSFIIENGTVRFRDARSGRSEVVTGLRAELGADSLIGPFAATGAAVYREVPLEFDVSLDRLVENGATALSLSVTLPQAAASGSFLGALSRHQELRTLRGRLQAKGEDFARLVRGLPLDTATVALPPVLARPFAVTAEVSGSDSEATADSIALELGDVSLDGKIVAAFGDVPDITASFAAKTIDLDKLLAERPEPAAGEAPAAATSDRASDGASDRASGGASGGSAGGADAALAALPASLPRDMTASLTLRSEALLYRGQTVRQVDLAARLQDGRIRLERAAAQLPGSSDIALDGEFSLAEQGPRFGGKLAASSDNLRGLLRWLGVELAAVPAERLRRLALTTGIEAAPGQVTLRGIDLNLDVSRLSGGVAVALRERHGFGIGVTLDRINLDAYLPPGTAAPATGTGTGAAAEGAGEAGAPAQSSETVRSAGLPILGAFDANIDLKVGHMTYRGLPLNGLRLDATLQRGGLVVREFSVADIAGSRGRFAGSLSNVDREPSMDGSLDVSVAALSRLAKAFGFRPGGQLPLESFTLSGAVNGNREALRFDQKLTALGGSLRAAGKAELQPAAPRIAADLVLDHPDLSVLLGELARGASVPGGLGPVALKGRLAGAPEDFGLSGLAGKVAGTEVLSGELAVDLAADRRRITADLTTGEMPLATLAAPAAAAGTRNSGAAAGGSGRALPSRKRWSTKPIDVSALRGFDADVKLRAKALLFDALRLDNADLAAVLTGGVLDLTKFDAEAYGGALAVTGKADFRESAPGGMEVAAAVNALDVELEGLLRDLADSDRFSGPLSLEGSLNTHGSSEAALVSALNGRGKLEGSVTVSAKAEEQAGALVLDLLGKKVKEVRGVTDTTTMLFGAFAGAPADLDGSFVVEQGVLRSDDLTVRGRDARALTAGNLNLPAWQMESRTDVFRDPDPENAYLTAVLRGPLDRPDVRLGGQPFQRRDEPAATEQPSVTEEPKEGQPLAPLKPEELLKEGVKGLLKGLGG